WSQVRDLPLARVDSGPYLENKSRIPCSVITHLDIHSMEQIVGSTEYAGPVLGDSRHRDLGIIKRFALLIQTPECTDYNAIGRSSDCLRRENPLIKYAVKVIDNLPKQPALSVARVYTKELAARCITKRDRL